MRVRSFSSFNRYLHSSNVPKFAKLEQNLILAYILTTFDFELTNATGAPRELPPIDPNAHSAVKPSEDVYLKYTSRLE